MLKSPNQTSSKCRRHCSSNRLVAVFPILRAQKLHLVARGEDPSSRGSCLDFTRMTLPGSDSGSSRLPHRVGMECRESSLWTTAVAHCTLGSAYDASTMPQSTPSAETSGHEVSMTAVVLGLGDMHSLPAASLGGTNEAADLTVELWASQGRAS